MPQPLNQKTKPVTPRDIPWPGVVGFHTDLKTTVSDLISLETLNQQKTKNNSPTAGDENTNNRKTTTIYKKNDAYYVYFHVDELSSDWGQNLTSFSLWLMSLSEKDIVYLYQTGDTWNLTCIVQILGILGTQCMARKIFVVDHPIENALFLLVCDDVIFTKLGALTFTNCMDIDPSKWDLIYTPYLKSLYAKAVEKNYITTEEVDAVFNNNAIIFKTANQLRSLGIPIV